MDIKELDKLNRYLEIEHKWFNNIEDILNLNKEEISRLNKLYSVLINIPDEYIKIVSEINPGFFIEYMSNVFRSKHNLQLNAESNIINKIRKEADNHRSRKDTDEDEFIKWVNENKDVLKELKSLVDMVIV